MIVLATIATSTVLACPRGDCVDGEIGAQDPIHGVYDSRPCPLCCGGTP